MERRGTLVRSGPVEKMLNDLELGECKTSVVPCTETAEQKDDNEQLDVECVGISWPRIDGTSGAA